MGYPYVRDSIPVFLWALEFVHWVEQCSSTVGTSVVAPSGYISTMRKFVERVARELRPRLGLKCIVEMRTQTYFSQPMVLVNDTPIRSVFPTWGNSIFGMIWQSIIGDDAVETWTLI